MFHFSKTSHFHRYHFFIFFNLIIPIIITTTTTFYVQSHVLGHEETMPNRAFPTHFNFLKGRKRSRWCGHDPNMCSDPVKNPWGGPTCCFQRYCKDTKNDPNHCGSCGRVCGFGWACCGGKCVDTRNDPMHCGACFEVCPTDNACSYSMCDYSG